MELTIYGLVLIVFVGVFTIEVIAPASGNDCDKRWQIYAGGISAFQMVVTLAAGWIFRDWFIANSLFHLPEKTPILLQALIAFFMVSFIAYWWHRATHASDFLWRVFHQLHHSPSRIESLTAFYVHPLDGLAANMLNAFVAYMIFGTSIKVAAIALLIAAIYNIYIHSDTRSPHWLGVIVQRPEMHRVHHKSGAHKMNYGLPIWDILFGTFKNPTTCDFKCGFAADKEKEVRNMLLLRDVRG